MPRFEVVIPAAAPEQPFEVRLRADAETWLPALKLGVEKICGGALTPSILCEVQEDGTVHATDPSTGRSFRIVELRQGGRATDAPARPAAGAQARPAGRSVAELEREELLADVFLRGPRVLERTAAADGLGYLLELALEKVRCAGGRAFLATSDGVLAVAAARGAGAEEAVGRPLEIRMGAGVVGFSAKHAVGLAVSDVHTDRRWHGASAGAAGEPARSALCAPMCRGGRVFGVLELFDRTDGPFDAGDQAVLDYLSHQASRFLEALEARHPA